MITAVALAAVLVSAPERSAEAVRIFRRHHLCPATQMYSPQCPGYVVDHIVPLACWGADEEANMQYQTLEEGKAKDRWELAVYCRSTGDVD